MVENGGKRIPFTTQLGYTREQVEVIHRLKNCRSDHERLGVSADASKSVVPQVLACGDVVVVVSRVWE